MHKREAQEYRKRYLISSAKKEDCALADQQDSKQINDFKSLVVEKHKKALDPNMRKVKYVF